MFARGGDNRAGDFARSAREIKRFAKAYTGHNIYVAPNPTQQTGGMRHAAKDVTHWSYFLIDVDPVCTCPKDVSPKRKKCDTCRGKVDPARALEDVLLRLGEWLGRDFSPRRGYRPIIIDSGRGYQSWIRLEDLFLYTKGEKIPYQDSRIERNIARRVNSHWLKRLDERMGLMHGCKIDTSVSDLPRVMRCPGTINVKTGRMAQFVHATDHVFGGLAELLVTGTPKEAVSDPEPAEGVAPGQPWQDVFPHLTRMAQEYLKFGQEEPGRHKVMWHTAKKLHELGVTRQEAWRALYWANRLKGKREELPREQIRHALDTAYNG